MKQVNYISEAIANIREMFKTGGFLGNDAAYSYWLIVWKNGDETIVDNGTVAFDGLPKMNARKIREIRSWFSGGPGTYHIEEIYTKADYKCIEDSPKEK